MAHFNEEQLYSTGADLPSERSFVTKTSGERVEFPTGMRRDSQVNKPRYDLIDRPFLKRWAELMARGAEIHGESNWQKAETQEELQRFRSSAFRHLMQWLEGEEDEDHAAAVAFNLAGAEMVKTKLSNPAFYRQVTI